MQKLKRVLRLGTLYVATVMLVSSPSMAAFAEDETYSYDQASGRWNSSKWVYDSKTGVYVPANTPQTPPPSPTPSSNGDSDKSNSSSSDQNTSGTSNGSDTISGSGPSSNNGIKDSTTVNGTTNVTNGTQIDNKVTSDAKSGNAGVTKNAQAGDATSGNANADTTIINSVHSTVGNGETSGVARFTIDLNGDVNGDIVVGPTMGTSTVDKSTTINSNTNIKNDDSITNNVTLGAKSGDATVNSNTVGGSAKSGDANAVANLLNLVNTVIGANKSYVGTINIHGNLNGDILISPDFVPQLLGSNAQVSDTSNLSMATHMNDDKTIVNNVDLNATSGTASVKDNTNAGSATSGTAQTDLQILNLTGHQVVAENSVLVFVNVKGKWVGMILDAPGATAAAFASGVVSNTVNANSTTNVDNKAAITNNLKLNAASGDATVSSNTNGGDATTGNARASANIANISSSVFSLSGWFAVLFINIDGDFYGGVLQQTPAGDVIGVEPISASAGGAAPTPSVGSAPNIGLSYKKTTNPAVESLLSNSDPKNTDPNYAAAVLASAVKTNDSSNGQTVTPSASPREDPFSQIMMISGLGILGASGLWWAVRRWLF